MTEDVSIREKKFNRWITVTSIAIPLVVALLFGYKIPNVIAEDRNNFLLLSLLNIDFFINFLFICHTKLVLYYHD